MTLGDRLILIGVLCFSYASYVNSLEAHRHAHLILCGQGVQVEGAHCHD